MLVSDIMKKNLITLGPDSPIYVALELLHKHHIRHIPIVDESNQVIGIVSDRDVRDASPSIFASNQSKDLDNAIKTIMSTPVVAIHPLDFVEEIASIFYEEEFACLPVVQDNKLVGIVTEKDMLQTLIQLTGTHVQGSQIEIKVPDQIGMLPQVTKVVGQRRINITSVLVYPYTSDPKYRVIVFRVQTMNPLPIVNDLKDKGFDVLWPQELEKSNEL
ncbi:acetoin utilization AcuB family protein [Aquibacillus salsiterrae]|uniref:Acetoin utilization AcuB family protein n=1 Tax=Aquibacillus salsiterrae TaxID=2950439 RepID=A0A9X3WD08_9BACI|nr:acetoin utilization AcuB family protein [Aquibacillus salsiterrae]MDC3415785.1 acetoin utilization AcuB family protein [Aquibacillus salsiterrae]